MSVLANCLAVVLGLFSGLGFCCYIGIPLVPTLVICPLIVVYVGTLNGFIFLTYYSLTAYLSQNPAERCRVCIQNAGTVVAETILCFKFFFYMF